MAEPALSYLIQHVHDMIPKQLLAAAFGPGGPNNYKNTDSIDRVLRQEVFIPTTLRQINLTCGRYKMIILNREWKQPLEYVRDSSYYGTGYYAAIYKIPPHARDFGPITAVERIESRTSYIGGYGYGQSPGNFGSYGNTVTNMGAAVLASRTLSPQSYNPRVYLLDNQTIKVAPDDRVYMSDLQLQCQIGYDAELTNADPSLIESVRKLFLCDVKIRIYNSLDIPTNEVEVTGGSEISRFKERFSEYANAIEEREELLEKMRGSQYWDPEILQRLMSYSM